MPGGTRAVVPRIGPRVQPSASVEDLLMSLQDVP
ncbi:MAG: hypothetical protein QOI47_1701 [Actinomycetota bacterium]|nr:hypothetical protein [Actinomycetota bacterium]